MLAFVLEPPVSRRCVWCGVGESVHDEEGGGMILNQERQEVELLPPS